MIGDAEHFFKDVLVRCLTFIVSVQLLSHVRLLRLSFMESQLFMIILIVL